MRIQRRLLPIALVLLVLGYWVNSRLSGEVDLTTPEPQEALSEMISADPKDFTLRDARGEVVRLSDFRGRPVLLNFWASWCPPCVEELPSLLKFADWARRELGVETLGVTVDTDWKTVSQMFREKKFWPRPTLPLTILLDAEARVAPDYGTTKYPETYFIDRNFKIIRKFIGPQNWMSQEIVKWMAEHAKEK